MAFKKSFNANKNKKLVCCQGSSRLLQEFAKLEGDFGIILEMMGKGNIWNSLAICAIEVPHLKVPVVKLIICFS